MELSDACRNAVIERAARASDAPPADEILKEIADKPINRCPWCNWPLCRLDEYWRCVACWLSSSGEVPQNFRF